MAEQNSESESATQGKRLWEGLSTWGLAFGCVIGWGSFVMPGTTFLPGSGPLGTIVGMLLATAAMMVVVLNYSFLSRHSDERGSYPLIKRLLGSDHGFLAAWCLALAYLSLLWANATAFVLVGRYLLGDVFQWGFHYAVGGYDVYLGEVVVTIAIQLCFGLLVCFADRLATGLRTVAAIGIVATVALLCVQAAGQAGAGVIMNPPFAPDEAPVRQVLAVVVLAPWMFVGFETVFHEPGNKGLSSRGLTGAASLAVAAGALVYLALVVVAASGAPAAYGSWVEYMADLGNLQGFEGMPVLYNARAALGQAGVGLVAAAIFCALSTSMLGFYRAAGRIMQTMAADGLMPAALARETRGVPRNAILAIMAVSLPVSLLGRTAVGWNADVSTLSVAIVYAYLSLCAFRVAREAQNRRAQVLGAAGLAISVVIFFLLLVPNLFFDSALATESYFMLGAWSLLGILYYWAVYRRDEGHRFGESPIMWILMLFLLLFSVIVWSRLDAERHLAQLNPDMGQQAAQILTISSFIQIAVVVLALVIMFNLFLIMLRRQKELDLKIAATEAQNKAKTSFLSNMSHDMRTPMNAIVGFTNLALQAHGDQEKVHGYLEKIRTSSDHLLSLINDVLEMSRVESGKIELEPAPVNLLSLLDGLQAIIAGQAQDKHQRFSIEAVEVSNPVVLCDKLRMNQVFLNLVSNAIKYTPEGGTVAVRLVQTGPEDEGRVPFEIHVKDNGMGMTPEFAERVFEAFEREKSSTVNDIQGTGLGMAITKRIVDLMGGSIDVDTAPGVGTEFTVRVQLEVCGEDAAELAGLAGEAAGQAGAGAGTAGQGQAGAASLAERTGGRQLRLLLVDDLDINREIAVAVLEMNDFLVEEACNGREAVQAVEGNEPGYFDAVLMDIQMPEMNGYEAAAAIRALPDEGRSRVPIIAVTANAFEEDRRAAFDAGMDGHVPKPIDADRLMATLDSLIAS